MAKSQSGLTRRSFVKLAAAATVASAMGSAGFGTALAEVADNAEPLGTVKRIRSCCRACGKMECGVWVTVQDGRAVKVEGDPSCLTSAGNCCSKSQASLQAAYHPARLHYPMKRTNPKTDADPGWVRISWEEAFETSAQKLSEIKEQYGGEALCGFNGTSRVYSMTGYGALRAMLDSPNMIVAWQVCKGPRHWATSMDSEFAWSWQATVDRPKVVVRWGSATELSNYDDSCRTTVDAAMKADDLITVDPRLANLGKESSYWMNLYPQTDGALALSLIDVVINEGLYDELFVKKWTNAPYLVCDDVEPSGGVGNRRMNDTYPVTTRLLKESDLVEGGSVSRFMVWDEKNDRLTYYDVEAGCWEGQTWSAPTEGHEVDLPNRFPGVEPGWIPNSTGFAAEDGFETEIDPALHGTYEVTLKDGTVSQVTTVWDRLIERAEQYTPEIASEITGIPAQKIIDCARVYATREEGQEYGNGGIAYMLAQEHGCNSVQNNRAIDILAAITGNYDTPGGMRGPTSVGDGTYAIGYSFAQDCDGVPYPGLEQEAKQAGIEKFPMLGWWQYWCDVDAAFAQMGTDADPYRIRGGVCQSGDFMSMGNSLFNWDMLTNLDFFLVLDLWHTPLSGKADILMPVYHWLEAETPRPSQGAGGGFGAGRQTVAAPAECKYDPEIMVTLFKYMGMPWSADESNPWPSVHELLDQAVAKLGVTWDEFAADFQENGWWDNKAKFPTTWGTYRRYEMGKVRTDGKQGFATNTGKVEIWSTVAESFQAEYSDYLPDYREAPQSRRARPDLAEEYPFICNTGRRIPVYFHSEHRQLPWCRELWPVPKMEIHPDDAAELGLQQGDWVWIENQYGKIRQTVDIYEGIQRGIINAEHQWWYPELEQSGRGFELSGVNCLVPYDCNDRICGSGYLRAYPVKVYKATPENSPFNNPVPCGLDGTEIITSPSDPRLKDWERTYEGRN